MPEINNLEDASTATEQLFAEDEQLALAQEPAAEPAAEEQPTDPAVESAAEPAEEPATEAQTAEQQLGDAAQIAETAAEAAVQQNEQNAQLVAELEASRAREAELMARIEELSNNNASRVVEEALEPPTPPDFHSLAFASEEEQNAAQDKYVAELAEYNRKQLMKEFAPALEFAKKGQLEQERNMLVAELAKTPEFADMGSMMPQIEKIIQNNKSLASDDVSTEDKLVTAYLIAKGVNSVNNPPVAHKEPTTEELMAAYNANPAFQEMIEKQRLAQINHSQQVPPFSASSGAVNAALNIKEKPQNLEEASRRTREMFGMN